VTLSLSLSIRRSLGFTSWILRSVTPSFYDTVRI
jgi:hypothetical protein